jgi:uncharacterized membrane protein HdeD (DUF308 family)
MSSQIKEVAEYWWVGVLQGVFALAFAAAALFWPGLTLKTLVYLFSAYVLVWSLVEIFRGLSGIKSNDYWWLSLIFGIFGTGVGVYLVRHPEVTFATFILLIGFTFILRGIVDIISAFLGGQLATSRALSLLVGAAALIVGIVVLNQPVEGGVAFVWILGLYSLVYGVISIALSLDLKKLNDA